MDEFFEALTMIQTGKFQKFPVVLMGKEFHKELYDYLQKMVMQRTISKADIDLFLFTDSVTEAMEHIEKYAIEGFGLTKRRIIKPIKILGEKGINFIR